MNWSSIGRVGYITRGGASLSKVGLALAILLFTGCAMHGDGPALTQDSTRLNKQIVADFFQRFSDGQIDQAFALVSDEVSWWVPGDLPFSGTKTKSEYLYVVDSIQNGFPGGLELVATSMIAEGDRVAVEVASNGTHANGRTYKNTYHFLITIAEGQMIEVKEYMDTLHLFQLIQP